MMTPPTSDESTYWQRLKGHPGVPWVIFWTWAGLWIAGRTDWRCGVMAAAAIVLTFGPVVLWTARK